VEQKLEIDPYTANKIDEILEKANVNNLELNHMFIDGSRFININGHPIFGYCRYYDFYNTIVKMSASEGVHFVEVGSFMGQSSAIMAYLIEKSGKNITFDCVDIFEISDFSDNEHEEYVKVFGGDMFTTFATNLKLAGLSQCINQAYKGKSTDVAQLYEDMSVDVVYLDASHKYEDVKDDILAWWSKIKINGYLAGDDFDQSDVRDAVLELFNDYKGNELGVYKKYGTWFVRKDSVFEVWN